MDEVEIHKTLALRIRALRLSKKMSVDDMAKAVGLSSHLITRFENGSSLMTASQLVRIANALGVMVSVVIGEIPANEKKDFVNG